ncbi:MAG: ATP-binding protein [Candidatus Dependentiae bacterium]|nr:ATP-binding protein [Candidatus Dependentiae bacterium]
MNLNTKIMVILLLLFGMQAVFCTDNNASSTTENKKEFDKALYFTPIVHETTVKSNPPFGQATQYNNELDPVIADLSCQAAPEQIKNLIAKLALYPKEVPKKRQYLFVGPPGTGKTTLAQAVAQKAGWKSVVIPVPELANEYQNSAASGLKRIIDPLLTAEEPCVIVLDELTHITDNYKQKLNYNNDAAAAVWSLLDRCKEHENIIVIATSNDISDLPPQMKSRFNKSGIIEIPFPDYTARGYLLCYLLNDFINTKSSYDMGSYVRYLATITEGKSFRDIMDFCEEVAYNAEQKSRRIQREDIHAVIKKWRSKWHPVELYRSCKSATKSIIKESPTYIPIISLSLSLYHTFLQESQIMHNLRKYLLNKMQQISPPVELQSIEPIVALPAIATHIPTQSSWSSLVSLPASGI